VDTVSQMRYSHRIPIFHNAPAKELFRVRLVLISQKWTSSPAVSLYYTVTIWQRNWGGARQIVGEDQTYLYQRQGPCSGSHDPITGDLSVRSNGNRHTRVNGPFTTLHSESLERGQLVSDLLVSLHCSTDSQSQLHQAMPSMEPGLDHQRK
jgi:hypothetical protein